ncbi:hypothetical protein GNI_157820 [Gregarina niphandrodes]|uniref:Uncharacterized protein n=1 Tax=Gregarina niphandrodes TaxID=110365 RepID=A0A023AYW1_GRENI|nr:hypothetical protein GNI_157820 [Gregarina niphandrodes]EZG43819.1 hypothetical protein GNI_157820 [Gregarina niphandrodes]|eukprot:XP_011133003.1 hypothetical protein GNI_157820 [Gregarina niphandrodes]
MSRNRVKLIIVVWKNLVDLKTSLEKEIDSLVKEQVAQSDELQNQDEWTNVCEMLKQQRDALEAEIEAANKRIQVLDEEHAKPTMKDVQESLASLRDSRKKRMEIMATRQQVENLLEEYHGIVVPSTDEEELIGVQDLLMEEEETMIAFYEAKLKRNSRIFDINVSQQAPSQDIALVLTPKGDWFEFWSRNRSGCPSLKFIKVVYSRTSPTPKDISIKVNTSDIPIGNFDQVMNPFIQKIMAWKQSMLQSTHLDLHGLIKLFF